jgi:ribonuclease HI
MEYTLYTDGAYSVLHNEGAFAFVILKDGEEIKRMAGKIIGETNNRAELKAIIAGVFKLPSDATSVRIVSDSMYALNTLSGSWSRISNTDLFEVWNKKVLSKRKNLKMEFLFVKGHSGDVYNELCDRLCVEKLGYDPREEYNRRQSMEEVLNTQ